MTTDSLIKLKIKLGLDTSDTEYDEVLTTLWSDAEYEVLNYTNRDELLPRMEGIVRDIVGIYFDRCKNEVSANVTSINQGDISVSYDTDIPKQILRQLNKFTLSKMTQLLRRSKR